LGWEPGGGTICIARKFAREVCYARAQHRHQKAAGDFVMRTRILLLGGLVASVAALSASAQTSVDRSFTTVSKDCNGVQWTAAALRAHPKLPLACQGVEERDGKTFVRLEGTVDKNINKGEQVAVKFKDAGSDAITLTPKPDAYVYIDGKKTAVGDLKRGDKLTFYISEDRLAAQFPDETNTQYVVVPVVVREQVAAAPMEEEPEQTAALPATGSDLPLLVLSGVMLLGLGAGLTVRRLRR
jgi:LPXTG-motif cell wall-anchored protein